MPGIAGYATELAVHGRGIVESVLLVTVHVPGVAETRRGMTDHGAGIIEHALEVSVYASRTVDRPLEVSGTRTGTTGNRPFDRC